MTKQKIFGVELSLGGREELSTLVAVGVFLVIGGLFIFSLKNYLDAKDKTANYTQEVVRLEQQIKNNQSDIQTIGSGNLDGYNRVLSALIPEQEDFYSIINALDIISQESGFIITGYTIDAASLNRQKIDLKVEGVGDSLAFTQFLQSYQFEGGRLITNEKVEFATAGITSMKLNLNFYNKKFAAAAAGLSRPLNVGDRQRLEEIGRKIKINLTGTTETAAADYKTKDNPF